MVFSKVNNVKDIVLDCFLFESKTFFSEKKLFFFFLVSVAIHNTY